MRITAPALRLYRNSEFVRYMKNAAAICSGSNPRLLQIETQLEALLAAIVPLDELFMIERSHQLTPELKRIDARRDDALNGLLMAARTFVYHYNPAVKKAAALLGSAIGRYGTGLSRLNYVAETEIIESLVADIAGDAQLAAAIATLQLQDWVEELKTANALFNAAYIQRTGSYAQRPGLSFTALRSTAAGAYELLAAHIAAYSTIAPSEALTRLIGELNSLTEQYNRLAYNRSTGDTGQTAPG